MKNLLLNIEVPSRTCHVTESIIANATPDNRGLCFGALSIRETFKGRGVQSIYVTPDSIRFSLPTKLNGKIVMVRYGYTAPAPLAREAHLFDYNADKHGSEYARKHAKPFSFRLQGRDGWAKLPVKQPSGDKRKKRRASSAHERVSRCARRYHPEAAYRVHEARA